MELHQLRYFVAVAEAGTVSRAAARCHVAQPSLSQQIMKLEQGLGRRLFGAGGEDEEPEERALHPSIRCVRPGDGNAKNRPAGRPGTRPRFGVWRRRG